MAFEVKYWILAHIVQFGVAGVAEFTFKSKESVILEPKVLGSPFETLAPTCILNFKPGLDTKICRIHFCKLKLEFERSFKESYVCNHLNRFSGGAISDCRNDRFCPDSGRSERPSVRGCCVRG